MEQYKVTSIAPESMTIVQGKFTQKVSEKHKQVYGDIGAANIKNNILETFAKLQLQLLDNKLTNNTLLVGKVQSGKTSNLELFTALAFDNGYKVLVIYGGYDNSLLKQTTDRFRLTFDSPSEPDYNPDYPAIFTTAEDTNLTLTDDIFKELLETKPIIFVSMKRPKAMSKINALLSKMDMKNIKSFIIDDEGDQASLNTAKNKKEDSSATYKQITEMKRNLNQPLYLSVTATPQANIYLDEYSEVKPASIHLIQPGKGYTGGDVYHLNDDNHIIEVIDETDEDTMLSLPESLKDAIRYFIIASAVKTKEEFDKPKTYSDMIIHTVREVSSHKGIYTCVQQFLANYISAFKNNVDDLDLYYKEFEKTYDIYLEEEYKRKYSFDELKEEIKNITIKVYVILKNSAGKSTQGSEELKLHKIYIGGDLLQRGLTFKNLITKYFTRWARNGGNMDTNLQRARWFGYREKYINLCKIFTTKEIAIEFSNLAEMDNNIWEQFDEVENGSLDIDDIIIEAENTKQSPTSKNKASFKKLSFRQKWKKQRNIVWNEKDVYNNNLIMKNFISSYTWIDTDAGSTNGKVTAKHSTINASEIKLLLENTIGIFSKEDEVIQKDNLLRLFDNQEIDVLLMQPDGKAISRSLYLNDTRIKALQEGRRKSDDNESSYHGDAKVLLNTDRINVQIYYVEPCYKQVGVVTKLDSRTQYVFAFYVPGDKTYFVKDKK